MKKSLLVTFVLSALICSSFSSLTLAAEKGPIKIGWLSPLTGQWAEVGKDMTNGLLMYLEEVGYKAAGRQITLVREDTQGLPDTAVVKTRKVVNHERLPWSPGW